MTDVDRKRVPSTRRVGALALAIFALGLGLAAMRTLDAGDSLPRIHDEFSYLLGADTFRSGRLTNPRHQLASHFETFHVLQQPTYASKYPPAQALVLALGWRIGGRPIVGVWIGFGAMAAALYWMSIAWLDSESWALLASVAATCWLADTYWANTYWGGAVAATGGALLYGGAARLLTRATVAPSIAVGVGLAILANSRPFEGFLAAIPVFVLLARLMLRSDYAPMKDRAIKVMIPLGIIGVCTVGAMAVYDRAVTGSATTFPYMVYQRTKETIPLFVWEKPQVRTPYNTRDIAFQRWARADYDRGRGLANGLEVAGEKLSRSLAFLLPLVVCFPLLLVPRIRRDQSMALGVAAIGFLSLGVVVSNWYQPHYVAPIVAPFVGLYFACLRVAPTTVPWLRGRGPLVTAIVLVGWIAFPLFDLVGQLPGFPRHVTRADWATDRTHLSDSLSRTNGKFVLLVRYPADYSPHHEWVYNGADVDGQHVVWARDLGTHRNDDLLKYYADRNILTVEPSAGESGYRVALYDRRENSGQEEH